MLVWMMSVALVAQVNAEPSPTVDKVRDQIVAVGYKRVAVCPRPICRSGDEESFSSSIVGPQGRVWCDNLYNFLNANAREDGFSMTNPRTVGQAMAGLSLEDLGDRAKLQLLSVRLDADVLVIVEVIHRPEITSKSKPRSKVAGEDEAFLNSSPDNTDEKVESLGPTWTNQAKLINLVENTSSIAAAEKPKFSLSDWAFMGHSFEARRWNGDRLELVGFKEGLRLADGFAMGIEAEERQYAYLDKDRPHPLRSGVSLPYGVQILVSGEPQPPTEFRGEYYVELNPGQQFGFRLRNDDTHSVMCALYIDGVNTIGQQFQHPMMNPPKDRWDLDPHSNGRVEGWFQRPGAGNAQQTIQPFRIVPKPQSVAAGFGQTVDGNFGMITAIFYTNGVDGITPAPNIIASTSRGGTQFGVGADQAAAINLAFGSAKAGLMLAAVTVHYRTSEELKKMLLQNLPNKIGD